MNLRDLEYVVALESTMHFGQAAKRCNVTQPTLSMQLANLENELGVLLFERQRRRIALTPQGRLVARQAAVILSEVHKLRELARPRSILSDQLRLGIIHSAGPYLLPHLLRFLAVRNASTRLMLQDGLTAGLTSALFRGELDAAVLSLPLSTSELEYEPLLHEPFMVALYGDHPLVQKQRITPRELASEQLLILEEGHCMRQQVAEFCPQGSAEGQTAGSIETLRQMVYARMGIAVLPYLSTIGGFERAAPLVYRPLSVNAAAVGRTLALAWRKRSYAADELRTFAADARRRLTATTRSRSVRVPRRHHPSATPGLEC